MGMMLLAPSIPGRADIPNRREWTVDDLVDLPRDLNYELINGRLILPSPTIAHQDVCFHLLVATRQDCPPEFVVVCDLSLEIDHRNEPRPDVVAVRIEHYNRSPVPVADAILAVEVHSPSTAMRDIVEKSRVYAAAGIQRYWMIDQLQDPIRLTTMVLDPATGSYVDEFSTTERFTTTEPWPIVLDLPALTARRRAILERAKPADG